MSILKKLDYISIDEYLDGEKTAQVHHEYIDGATYAMVGASAAHNLLSGTLATLFRNHLAESCHVYQSDMKIKVESGFYYPDIIVTCTDVDLQAYFLASPCLIVEILSESTEAKDRLEKRVAYQKIASLKEYVLVSQKEKKIEVIRRAENTWIQETYSADENINFESISFSVGIDKIYQEISPYWPSI